MQLALPPPSKADLAKAPLEMVVCQVRHERKPVVADPARTLAVRSALKYEYPDIEEQSQQELSFLAGPAGMAMRSEPNESRGWRFLSKDKTWVVALFPDFFTLECTGYSSWTEFKSRLSEVIVAVHAEIEPVILNRIGLRYIDRIEHPDVRELADWSRWVDPTLLGGALHPGFGSAVVASQSVVQLDASPNNVLLRFGPQRSPEDRWQFVLDTDSYQAKSQQFEPERLVDLADELHTLALQVFQNAVTNDLIEYLENGVQ